MTSRSPAPARAAIPDAAWRRGIGVPVAGAGRSRVSHEVLVDDGPWGGVPLGGLGSGSIGRTPRGDFARWHLDIGTHRFESIPACQFSVFVDGRTSSAHALSTIRPDTLSAWNWDLPEGAGTMPAAEFLLTARAGLGPELGGVFDAADFRRGNDPAVRE